MKNCATHLFRRRLPVNGPKRPEKGVDGVEEPDAVDQDTPFAQAPFHGRQGLRNGQAAPEHAADADGVGCHEGDDT